MGSLPPPTRKTDAPPSLLTLMSNFWCSSSARFTKCSLSPSNGAAQVPVSRDGGEPIPSYSDASCPKLGPSMCHWIY
jgi:hypothetical protein